jgi:hypothetical protein
MGWPDAYIGCGGGGEDSTATNTSVSRDDIESVFKAGVNGAELIALYETTKMSYFAGAMIGASTLNSGSVSPTATNCTGGGSLTLGINKSGTYLGLKANDSLTYTFNNCKVSSTDSTVYNGGAVVTAITAASNLDTTLTNVSNLQYRVKSTNLSIALTSSKVVHNGSMNATMNLTSTAFGLDMTVPSGLNQIWDSYSSTTATSANLTTTAGSSSRLIKNLGPGTAFSLSYAGRLSISASGSSIDLDITTPTIIAGTVSSTTGRIVPTSGVMNVTEVSTPVATRGR